MEIIRSKQMKIICILNLEYKTHLLTNTAAAVSILIMHKIGKIIFDNLYAFYLKVSVGLNRYFI